MSPHLCRNRKGGPATISTVTPFALAPVIDSRVEQGDRESSAHAANSSVEFDVAIDYFEVLGGWAGQSNVIRACTATGEPSFSAGCNGIAFIAVATSFIFSSRRPLGDSVLNDSTRPLLSTIIIKTTLFVPDSRNFSAAAAHISRVAFSASESGCPVWAAVTATQAVRSNHRITFFIASTLRRIGA